MIQLLHTQRAGSGKMAGENPTSKPTAIIVIQAQATQVVQTIQLMKGNPSSSATTVVSKDTSAGTARTVE